MKISHLPDLEPDWLDPVATVDQSRIERTAPPGVLPSGTISLDPAGGVSSSDQDDQESFASARDPWDPGLVEDFDLRVLAASVSKYNTDNPS